jgi:hexosaminidase
MMRFLDQLAYYKFNILHWHLVDDQGWRIEIPQYPQLTRVGAYRESGEEMYGGFYTEAEIKEIIAHANKLYITIVPEMELPGHCMAALASYPELACNPYFYALYSFR